MLKFLCTMLLIVSIFFSGTTAYANRALVLSSAEPAAKEEVLKSQSSDEELALPYNNGETHCEIANAITNTKIEQRRVALDELFTVNIFVDATYIIESYTYEATGFDVGLQLSEVDNEIVASLKTIAGTEKPVLTLHIELQEGITVEPQVFGYVNEYGVFLSPSSLDDAWSYHLEYLKSQQIISEEVAEEMRVEYNKPYLEEEIDTEENSGPATRGTADTWVRGRIQWRDDDGVLHPLQYTALELRDEDVIEDDILGSNIYTDQNGDYVFGFENQTIATEQGGCDPYLVVYAIGIGLHVMVNNYYAQSSTVKNVATGSTTYINLTLTMDNDMGRAFQILQAAVTTSRYYDEMNQTGIDLGLVRIIYPDNNSNGCYYDRSTKNIYITGAPPASGMPQAYASWDVIAHEYGHHIQEVFDLSESPGGKHIGNKSMSEHYAGTDHSNCGCAQPGTDLAKYAGIRIAWGESWPTVLGIISQQYYGDILQNIKTVGDSSYTAYNKVDYNLENVTWLEGEGCEGTVGGVLYDFYDPLNEPYDDVVMGYQEFFEVSVESKAKTLSDFVNYCITNNIVDSIHMANILSHYSIAPDGLRTTTNLTQAPPTFTWYEGNGWSFSKYHNNSFIIVFYNEGGYEFYRTGEITTNKYTMTQEEWNNVLASFGTTFKAGVYGYQTSYPATGGYFSGFVKFTKPTASAITEKISLNKTFTYYETIVALQPGQYIDYIVRINDGGGNLIFQTFGNKDTCLYLYSERGFLHESDDNSGYGLNALVTSYLIPDTNYIVRLQFKSGIEGGKVKLGIWRHQPYNAYEQIPGPYHPGDVVSQTDSYDAIGTRHVVESAGTYKFFAELTKDSQTDVTFTYLIDPTSTEPCADSAGKRQGEITAVLQPGVEYLVITQPMNPFLAVSYNLSLTAESV